MADGPKFEDGQSTPEGIMDIHKGVDQDVPRQGIETPGEPIYRRLDDNTEYSGDNKKKPTA